MILAAEVLTDKAQTARRMYWLADEFYSDLGGAVRIPFETWFRACARTKYARDPKGTEILARPQVLFREFMALDCKKKAILIAAWLKANGIPYRYVAMSQRPDKLCHHVFPQAFVRGRWVNMDATYKRMVIGAPKKMVTHAEVLKRGA